MEELLNEMTNELEGIIRSHGTASVGLSGEQLIKIHVGKNAALVEAINRHDRTLKYLLGEKVEPVAHSGEAVLIGIGAGWNQ